MVLYRSTALSIIGILLGLVQGTPSDPKSTACSSPIYCEGPMLRAIQMGKVLGDGKEFVDRPSKFPRNIVIKNFKELGSRPSKARLAAFVRKNFHPAGYEVVKATMKDKVEQPKFLKKIKDQKLKGYGHQVHRLWSTLLREVKTDRICKGCESSTISTPYPFIVPGGRFREFYYWDTYFVLQGLNTGELYLTSKDMILNLLSIVDQYGMVPNGARKYYLNRSQPPMLIPMVKEYLEKNKDDVKLLERAIHTLDKEYEYWYKNHRVKVPCADGLSSDDCTLTRFVVDTDRPRPESYREDYNTVEHGDIKLTDKQKARLYGDLAAGAETGWDYSSRWVPDAMERAKFNEKSSLTIEHQQENMLRGIRTSSIIPVDLNSIMYLNEVTLAEFHYKLSKLYKGKKCNHHKSQMKQYRRAASIRAKLMEFNMWDSQSYSFYDYNIETQQMQKAFTSSNYWPFWVDALTKEFKDQPLNFINSFDGLEEVFERFVGGVPTSLLNSKLQWDLPNTWAPLEYVLVESLVKSADFIKKDHHLIDPSNRMQGLALKIAQKFVANTFCTWYNYGGQISNILPKHKLVPEERTGFLFEKYNATTIGVAGGGGEYEVQTGFGWSNGVVVTLMEKFGDKLVAPEPGSCGTPPVITKSKTKKD